MAERDDRDPLFRYEEPVFAREELLKISHVPEPDRIVGRDQHMQRVAEALNPAVFGREPDDLLVFGKSRTSSTSSGARSTAAAADAASSRSTDSSKTPTSSVASSRATTRSNPSCSAGETLATCRGRPRNRGRYRRRA
ncbi:origin of replication recognition protein / Cell division control protein 6 [Halarchaeum acidiphilum MH1-52-1]|uniref:Origin of replication recognition protein / Cell division control protein 6 n=1 Tax=Halarchaeum acidiphilum MH1-52-1 TaxID=1261545 RepID=U2YVP2_9EURY|nr:hypothetical protein [Halarchaeum acidiphilum]GAD52817.1 origin of replication recognition protein / Cell division control protein 6 [Halarchaeum acidiphilum MH1-52-1]